MVVLDTHSGSRDWINETDPKHTLIMASHLQQSVGKITFGGYFTAALIQAIHESKGRLTYKNLYKKSCEQLQQNAALLDKQTPLFITQEWDTYIFTHKQINPVLPVQLLLQELGYVVNADGIDGPQTRAAKQAFMKDHAIDNDEAIRFYLELKRKIQYQGRIQVLVVATKGLVGGNASQKDEYRSRIDVIMQAENITAVYDTTDDLLIAQSTASAERSGGFMEKLLGSCAVIIIQKDRSNKESFMVYHRTLETLVDLAFALDKEILLITELHGSGSFRFFDRLTQRHRPVIRNHVQVNFTSSADTIAQEITRYRDFLQSLLTINRKKSARTLEASYTEAVEQARQTGRLDISDQNLPEIPAVVFELSNLEELHASGNQIKLIPAAIVQLTQLKVLNLNGNPITVLPPELMQLQQLETLSLSNTDLQELPADINKLALLQQLYIHSTRLVVLPDALADLKQLNVLDARENHILNVPPAVLRGKTAPKKFKTYVKSFLPRTNGKPAVVLLGKDSYMRETLLRQLPQNIAIEVKEDDPTPVALYEILRKGVADQCLIYIADPQKLFEQFAFPDLHSWQRNLQQFFKLLNGQKINLFYDLSALSVYMLEDLPGIPAINAMISAGISSFTNKTSRFTQLFFEQYLAGSPISKSYAHAQQHTQNKKTSPLPYYMFYKSDGFTDSQLPPVVKRVAIKKHPQKP